MSALALLFAVAAFASEPPAYNPYQQVRSLRDAGQATISAVNDALATNIVKENAAAEKANLDRLAQHAKEASDAAQAVIDGCRPPLGELKALLEGTSSRRSAEARSRDCAGAVASAQDRLRVDSDQKSALDSRADQIKDPDELARAKSALSAARRSLDQAKGCLGESFDALSGIKEQQDSLRSAANRTSGSFDEMQRARETLAARATSAQTITGDAKAALDALGDDNATKARAFDRAQAAEDDGKAVFNQTSILALRSDDFGSRYSGMLSASARFDDAEKGFRRKLADCSATLDAGESSLAQAKEITR